MILQNDCICCGTKDMSLHTTDDETVRRCACCGMPYWLWPGLVITPAVSPLDVTMARSFWMKTQSIVFPADYNIMHINHAGVGWRDATDSELLVWNKFILPF